MFFMSFSRVWQAFSGAAKSVKADKHSRSTGMQAETGGNKRGNYTGLFAVECGATSIEGSGVKVLNRKQPHSTARRPD